MDDQQLLYRLWLCQNCGHDPDRVSRLLKKFGSPEGVFHANFYDPSFYRTMNLTGTLNIEPELEGAQRLLESCREQGIRILSITDSAYPENLRHTPNPPQVLYALGKLPDLNRLVCVTIVGTRRCSQEGRQIAEQLGRELSENGVAVISGMACGIDGGAHCGALQAGGTTLAVLAGGVDLVYPPEHTELYRFIRERGAILSERPPGMQGQPQFYRQRNRILAGISHGVVIVEGRERSGTSMTARLASEYSRDVFAVPGKPTDRLAELPNDLIRDGVKLVSGALDILEEYIGVYPEKLEYGLELKGTPVIGRISGTQEPKKGRSKRKSTSPKTEGRKPEEKQPVDFEEFLIKGDFQKEECEILRFLYNAGGAADFDELADGCEIDAGALSSMLIILQMKKAVAQSAGGRYALRID